MDWVDDELPYPEGVWDDGAIACGISNFEDWMPTINGERRS